MVKYVLQRIVLAFVTAFIILSLTFILVKLLQPEKVKLSIVVTLFGIVILVKLLQYSKA